MYLMICLAQTELLRKLAFLGMSFNLLLYHCLSLLSSQAKISKQAQCFASHQVATSHWRYHLPLLLFLEVSSPGSFLFDGRERNPMYPKGPWGLVKSCRSCKTKLFWYETEGDNDREKQKRKFFVLIHLFLENESNLRAHWTASEHLTNKHVYRIFCFYNFNWCVSYSRASYISYHSDLRCFLSTERARRKDRLNLLNLNQKTNAFWITSKRKLLLLHFRSINECCSAVQNETNLPSYIEYNADRFQKRLLFKEIRYYIRWHQERMTPHKVYM